MRKSRPMLGHLLVGDQPQSHLYVRSKLKACDEIGILHRGFHLPADSDQSELVRCINDLKDDPAVSGVLL